VANTTIIEGILPAPSQDVQEVCCNVVTSAIANIDLKGRFQPTTDISGQTTVKSSIQRGIRSAILSSWKIDVETLEEIWPKKESIVHVKWCVASILFRLGKRSRFVRVGGTHNELQQRSSINLHAARRTPLLPAFRRAIFPDSASSPQMQV
jgi:hypothetical protein